MRKLYTVRRGLTSHHVDVYRAVRRGVYVYVLREREHGGAVDEHTTTRKGFVSRLAAIVLGIEDKPCG